MIKKTDAKLNSERNIAFQDEIAIEKAEDTYVELLKKGDKKGADAVAEKIRALKADYKKNEKQVLALMDEESKEIAVEGKLEAKVKADKEELLKQEDKML